MSNLHDGPAPWLRRSLVGVSTTAAEQLLTELEQEFTARTANLQQQIAQERAECQRLQDEIDRQQERLSTAHNAVAVLRSKLAQERAAKAVLVARLMDQPLVVDEDRAREQSDMHFEEIRLSAESQREHEALRELVEQLYRTALAHGALPPGLEVSLPPPLPPEQPAPPPAKPAATGQNRWHKFLLGKLVGGTLLGPDGSTIATEGQVITPDIIRAAEAADQLFTLILSMRLTEVTPEL